MTARCRLNYEVENISDILRKIKHNENCVTLNCDLEKVSSKYKPNKSIEEKEKEARCPVKHYLLLIFLFSHVYTYIK